MKYLVLYICLLSFAILLFSDNVFGDEQTKQSDDKFVARLLDPGAAPATDKFMNILHKVPLNSEIGKKGFEYISPTGRYFVYQTLGDSPQKIIEIIERKELSGTEGHPETVEHIVYEARWVQKQKTILHLVDIKTLEDRIICDMNDPLFGHLDLAYWTWPLQEDKIYLKFKPNPIDVSLYFDFKSNTIKGNMKALEYLVALSPEKLETILNGHDYEPPIFSSTEKQHSIVAVDGKIYDNYTALENAGTRPLQVRDIRKITGINGQTSCTIFWHDKKYDLYISQNITSGEYENGFIIAHDRLAGVIPIAAPIFGKTDMGENIWFIKSGNELLLKRVWYEDRPKDLKQYFMSTANLGQTKLTDAYKTKTENNEVIFVELEDRDYRYWALLNPAVLTPDKNAEINYEKKSTPELSADKDIKPKAAQHKKEVIPPAKNQKPPRAANTLALYVIIAILIIICIIVTYMYLKSGKKT